MLRVVRRGNEISKGAARFGHHRLPAGKAGGRARTRTRHRRFHQGSLERESSGAVAQGGGSREPRHQGITPLSRRRGFLSQKRAGRTSWAGSREFRPRQRNERGVGDSGACVPGPWRPCRFFRRGLYRLLHRLPTQFLRDQARADARLSPGPRRHGGPGLRENENRLPRESQQPHGNGGWRRKNSANFWGKFPRPLSW